LQIAIKLGDFLSRGMIKMKNSADRLESAATIAKATEIHPFG
jgi:hypothetical protein